MLNVNKSIGYIAVLFALFSNPCWADFYIGGQGGHYKTEVRGFELDEADEYKGLYAGYVHGSGFGLELSVLSGDGETEMPERYRPDAAAESTSWDEFWEDFFEDIFSFGSSSLHPTYRVETNASAAFLTYHSSHALSSGIYFKAKIGRMREEMKLDVPDEVDLPEIEEERTAYGLGLGWRFGSTLGLDVEHTIIPSGGDYLKIGFKFNF
jgi:hypothetical protein